MRRGLVRILVFLLLGALLNVFVAWRYSCYGMNRGDQKDLHRTKASFAWERYFGKPLEDPSYESFIYRSFGYTELVISYESDLQDSTYDFRALAIHQLGMPFSSIEYASYSTYDGVSYKTYFENVVGFRSPSIGRFTIFGRATFPYGVLPFGFALNTIFYAASRGALQTC